MLNRGIAFIHLFVTELIVIVAGMPGVLWETCPKKRQWLPTWMRWSWYDFFAQKSASEFSFTRLLLWTLTPEDPRGHAHDGRGGGASARPRPVLRTDWGEEKDLACIRPEHRWGIFSPHQLCLFMLVFFLLFVISHNAQSLTVFFFFFL